MARGVIGRLREAIRNRIVAPAGAPEQARPARAVNGEAAEALAAQHLQAAGLRVLARNVRYRGGELDLVCLDGEVVVFVEVRLRRSGAYGGAAASITPKKQARVLLAAQLWLSGAGRAHAQAPCRFDAVLLSALDPAAVEWLRGAFDAG